MLLATMFPHIDHGSCATCDCPTQKINCPQCGRLTVHVDVVVAMERGEEKLIVLFIHKETLLTLREGLMTEAQDYCTGLKYPQELISQPLPPV